MTELTLKPIAKIVFISLYSLLFPLGPGMIKVVGWGEGVHAQLIIPIRIHCIHCKGTLAY
jgi:hypothetical protein